MTEKFILPVLESPIIRIAAKDLSSAQVVLGWGCIVMAGPSTRFLISGVGLRCCGPGGGPWTNGCGMFCAGEVFGVCGMILGGVLVHVGPLLLLVEVVGGTCMLVVSLMSMLSRCAWGCGRD